MNAQKSKTIIKPIFSIIILFSMPFVIIAQGNKYGVFVGISNYQIKDEKLPSSIKDARKVCNIFSNDCGNGTTKLLLDANATRAKILDSISYYKNLVKKGDLFVFYYSGHGTLFPDRLSEDLDESILTNFGKKNAKKLYDAALVPYDSKDSTSGKRWKNLILDDELYALFAEFTSKGAKVVFISDSCHSGGLAKGDLDLGETKDSKLGIAKFINLKTAIGLEENQITVQGIQKESHPENNLNGSYLLIASSAENELSYSQNPDTGTENSLFTYCLLKTFEALKSKKKDFTFNDITTAVKPMVEKIALANSAHQTPLINSTFYKGELNVPIF